MRCIRATDSCRRTRSSRESCAAAGLIFVGPTPEIMRRARQQGDGARPRGVAGVPVMPATPPLPRDDAEALRLAREVGFPVMLKASWGGGGRGMRVVEQEARARRDGRDRAARSEGRVRQRRGVSREARAARAPHRSADCSAIRTATWCTCSSAIARCSGAIRKWSSGRRRAFFTDEQRALAVRGGAQRSVARSRYLNAGTVEFLQDADTGKFYFIEVNPRIQVEHTVTEAVTGVDIVRRRSASPRAPDRRARQRRAEAGGHSPQRPRDAVPRHDRGSRRTTSSRTTGASPRIAARPVSASASTPAPRTPARSSRAPTIRCWSRSPRGRRRREETIARMHRALWEFRVRGVVTNLRFLDQLIMHPQFAAGGVHDASSSTRRPELFQLSAQARSRDAAAQFHRRRRSSTAIPK